MKRILTVLLLTALTASGGLPERSETLSFPFQTAVTEAGAYAVSGEGNELVLSGTISGNVTVSADSICRVTLDNVTLSGQLAIEGDAILWAKGTSALENGGRAVVTSTGALMLAGDGTATLAGGGAKKANAVVRSGDALTLAGGTWNVNMTLASEAKGFGISAAKKLKMVAGCANVVSACTLYKDTGVSSDKKDIAISGGILRVSQCGPKSVAIATDDAEACVKLSGGAVILTVGGAGAKGVKCDGTFEMSGGLLDATVSGGPLYEAYECDDGRNLVVTTTKSELVTAGKYLVEDVTASAAVKCGTVNVSGGTVRIVADGACSRGLVADTALDLSGGVFDIRANGALSEPVIDLVTDGVLTQVELDRKTAACIRQGDASGTAKISGGTFYLVATNDAGKCLSIDGALAVGTSGATTLPTDASFAPDIQCSTFGRKAFVAAGKLSTYTTLGTAVATADVSGATRLSQNPSRVATGGGQGQEADYANPKCIKVEGDVTVASGRLRLFAKCDGGEGLEAKANLKVDGGIVEGVCYDDIIQAGNSITVNGGYLYCVSTGNDGIDSNGTIDINGGVVLSFALTKMEAGIDAERQWQFRINGGIVLAVCSTSRTQHGSTGSQRSYQESGATLSSYSGKYLKIASNVPWIRIPQATDTSGYCVIMCSAPGSSGAAPTVSATPDGADIGFHVGSDVGKDQPDLPSANARAFVSDAFLTDAVTAGGCVVYGDLMTGCVDGQAAIEVPPAVTKIAAGALAGKAAVTTIDATASGLTEVPDAFATGCDRLVEVALPQTVTNVGASAFAMDSALRAFTGAGVKTVGDYAFFGCRSLALADANPFSSVGEAALEGVSYKTEEGEVYVPAIAPLVRWVKDGGAAVPSRLTRPKSCNTEDLRTWLTNDVANLEAYLYAEETSNDPNFRALSVSGTNFLFVAQNPATLPVAQAALQTSTDLKTWTTVSESDIVGGVCTLPETTGAFARIVYTLPW